MARPKGKSAVLHIRVNPDTLNAVKAKVATLPYGVTLASYVVWLLTQDVAGNVRVLAEDKGE